MINCCHHIKFQNMEGGGCNNNNTTYYQSELGQTNFLSFFTKSFKIGNKITLTQQTLTSSTSNSSLLLRYRKDRDPSNDMVSPSGAIMNMADTSHITLIFSETGTGEWMGIRSNFSKINHSHLMYSICMYFAYSTREIEQILFID